jgi:hypothetical protein
MKTRGGPHPLRVDANKTGPTFPKDGGLASSMGPRPTQALGPRDLRERPNLAAASEEGSVPHDLRFIRLQPTDAPPGEGRNMARTTSHRAEAAGQADLCCQVARP